MDRNSTGRATSPAELFERAEGLRAKTSGRIVWRGDPRFGRPAVIDPRGREVKWLSDVFNAMSAYSYSTKTFRNYAEAYLRFARCAWALDIDMETLTAPQYTVLRSMLMDPARNPFGNPYAARTLLVSEASLQGIYEVAVDCGLGITENPVKAVVMGSGVPRNRSEKDWSDRRAHRRSRIAVRPYEVGPVLTAQERQTLLAAEHPLDRALVQILDEAGPRVSEVLSIRLESLYPESNMIEVHGKSGGGMGSRLIPASPATFQVIDDYVEYLDRMGVYVGPGDPIFRSEANLERPINRWGVDRRLGAIVPGATPQKFRRTTATRLLRDYDGPGDAGLIFVRDVLGHASVKTTEQYLNYTKEQLAADFLDALKRDVPRVAPDIARMYDSDVLSAIDALKNDEEGS